MKTSLTFLNGLDDWISEIVIKFADSRDADIIQAIGKDPDNELPRGKPRGIKCAQLVK